jgi:hypothetical protein
MSFEVLFIIVLIGLQALVFFNVLAKIKALKQFFPDTFKNIQILKFKLNSSLLGESTRFDEFLNSLSNEKVYLEDSEQSEDVELLVLPSEIMKNNIHFAEVIKSTNAYLCKNKGASADFNILKDTCERYLEKVDNEIGNLINVPLYIGLGGTFVGIIIGLWGIDFSATTEGTTTIISSDSISQLLNGVIAAMLASLVGLSFTVVNSALFYKPAAYKNDTQKNEYYDFLQRELLPFLNIGVSKSLGSFKDVLNHFIKKFGENMDDYKDSGNLLNENLQKQQTVLEEINKLSLTRSATKIAEVFAGLKETSEHLEKFQNYQKGLNTYVDKTEKVSTEMNLIIEQFKDFNANLKAMSNSSVTTIELQKQFKDSLEVHFPTISDHRKVWRSQIDELNLDIKEVYKELNNYFRTSTEQIQGFIGNNSEFITGINEIQKSIKIFVENSSLQKDGFGLINEQLTLMRQDFKDSQRQSIETNKSMIEAIIDLKKTMSKLDKLSEK